MNYEAAQILLDKHRRLEGTLLNGKEITYLIIVPTANGGMAKVIDGINRNLSLYAINSVYDDFEIIGLLDFDDFHQTGVLSVKPLADILREL